MRVALITDEGPEGPGGVATWVGAVARGLAARGCEVLLADRRGGPALPGVERRAIGGPSFGAWGGVWALGLLPRLARADLVIAATWPVATQLVRAGLPLVVVAHGSDVTRPTRDPRGRGRVFRQAPAWAAVSTWVAGHVPRAVRVLPAPVEPASPGGRAGGVWGFVGRAVPTKGGDTFVRWVAAAGVRGELVGDGPALPAWRALATELRADVVFTGALPRAAARDRVARWDLLVAPSRALPDGSGAEGLGLVALEAAAVSVPAVVTAVGGLPEAAGPHGLVVADGPPRDVVAAIGAWWTAERGARAREHLAACHGVARTVDALLASAPGTLPG